MLQASRVLAFTALAALTAATAALAQPPAAPATGAAAAQAAYIAQCRRETLAQYPRANAQSICDSKWQQVTASFPMADAILRLAPATGAQYNAADVRMVSQVMLRGYSVTAATAPARGISINWSRAGEPIPFDLEGALRARGATLTMIACLSFGSSEGSRVYRVAATGKAPFALTIAFRNADVASQSSDYTATTDYSGRMPTVASLHRDGNDWAASCPQ